MKPPDAICRLGDSRIDNPNWNFNCCIANLCSSVVRQQLLSILLPVSFWLAWRNFLGIHSLLGVKVVILAA